MIERFRNVLVLAVHPDDEQACSGTLARLHAAGASIELITFSDCADISKNALIKEYSAATRMLGINQAPALCDLPNRHLPEHRQRILATLDDVVLDGYDLVLLPATSDKHQDHATVSAEGIRAFKRTTILGYELPLNTIGPSTWAGYVRLEPEHVDAKVQHAAIYKTQAHKPYMQEAYIRGLVAMRGMQAGVDAAEAFEVIRWVA